MRYNHTLKSIPHENKYKSVDFTPKHVQRLLNLIKTPKSNLDKLSGNTTWLLDSEASCHMTENEDLLHDTYDIVPIPCRLPKWDTNFGHKKRLGMLKF